MIPMCKPTFEVAVVKGTIVDIDGERAPIVEFPPQVVIE